MNKLSFYDTDNTDNQETPAPKEFKYANLLLALVALTVVTSIARGNVKENVKSYCTETVYKLPVEDVNYGDTKEKVFNEYKMTKVEGSTIDLWLFVIPDVNSPFESAHFSFKDNLLTDVVFKLKQDQISKLGGPLEAFPFLLKELMEKFGDKRLPKNTVKNDTRFSYTWPPSDNSYIGLHFEPNQGEIYLQYACAGLK